MEGFETLKLNKEFRRLYGRGKNFVSPVLVTYCLPNRRGVNRIGITAGKKIGGAVQRNRAKRVITAAFRQCLPHISGHYDFCFIARVRTGPAGSVAVYNAMKKHLKELGVWLQEDEKIPLIPD